MKEQFSLKDYPEVSEVLGIAKATYQKKKVYLHLFHFTVELNFLIHDEWATNKSCLKLIFR